MEATKLRDAVALLPAHILRRLEPFFSPKESSITQAPGQTLQMVKLLVTELVSQQSREAELKRLHYEQEAMITRLVTQLREAADAVTTQPGKTGATASAQASTHFNSVECVEAPGRPPSAVWSGVASATRPPTEPDAADAPEHVLAPSPPEIERSDISVMCIETELVQRKRRASPHYAPPPPLPPLPPRLPPPH